MNRVSKEKRDAARQEIARKQTRRILAVFTVLFVLGAVLAFPPAVASIRMFDAHRATENPATILLFLSFFSFPFVLLSSTILAWLCYVMDHFRRARLFLLLPLINLLGAGIGLAWLQIVYNGLFGGKL